MLKAHLGNFASMQEEGPVGAIDISTACLPPLSAQTECLFAVGGLGFRVCALPLRL